MAQKSKLQIQLDLWEKRKQMPVERAVLDVLAAALRYMDVAIRQRGQDYATVSIAADYGTAFYDQSLYKANRAYDRVAEEVRRLGGKSQRILTSPEYAQMKFSVLESFLGLEGVNYKQVQKRWREIKAQIKALDQKKKKKN